LPRGLFLLLLVRLEARLGFLVFFTEAGSPVGGGRL
jgi:hypothetical protein